MSEIKTKRYGGGLDAFQAVAVGRAITRDRIAGMIPGEEGSQKASLGIDDGGRAMLCLPADEDLPPGCGIEVAKGLMDHELAHGRYTRNSTIRNLLKVSPEGGALVNIMEDARVEASMKADLPGTHDTIAALNRYGGQKVIKAMQDYQAKGGVISDFGRLSTALALVHTAPEHIGEALGDNPKLREFFDHIKPFVDKATKAADSTQVERLARKACETLGLGWLKDEEPPPPPEPRGGGGKKGEGDGKDKDKGEGDSDKEDPEAEAEGGGEGEGEPSGDEAGEEGIKGYDPGGGADTFSPSKLTEEALKDAFAKSEKEAKLELAKASLEAKASSLYEPIYKIAPSSGRHDKEYTIGLRDSHRGEYKDLTDKTLPVVAGLRASLRTALLAKTRDKIIRSQEEGDIDEGMLYALATKTSDRVFAKTVHGIKTSTIVTLLVDCSGSMHGSSMDRATLAATALAESLYGIRGVDFEVLGFTTGSYHDGTTRSASSKAVDPSEWFKRMKEMTDRAEAEALADPEKMAEHLSPEALTSLGVEGTWHRTESLLHIVAVPFGTKDKRELACIAGLYASSNNHDGEAVRWAARRSLERKADRRILIVISDGYPAGSYDKSDSGRMSGVVPKWYKSERERSYEKFGDMGRGTQPNYVDLKSAIKVARDHGVEVYGIGITGATSAIYEFYGEKNAVGLTDSRDLPSCLVGELKTLLITGGSHATRGR
jgi:cobaltochelatase CobT